MESALAKQPLPQVIKPIQLDSFVALAVAATEQMSKRKGERDTEFVKRIVAAYLNAAGALGIDPIR